MPGIEHGLQRGLGVIVETVVIAVLIGRVVPVLVEAGLLPKYLFSLFMVMSIFGAVMMVSNSTYWSFGYFAGVCIGIIFGLRVFLQTGFLGPIDFLLYGGVVIGALALK